MVSAAGGGLFSTVTGAGVTTDNGVVRSGFALAQDRGPDRLEPQREDRGGRGPLRDPDYVRLASLPAADVAELLSVDAATGNDLRIGYQASSGRLTIRFGNAAVTTAATAISADTWYRLSLRVDVNGDPRTADWQIDGAPQTSVSWAGAASTVNTLRIGSSVNADAYTANYDDVIVSATSGDYPLGDGRVVARRPNGMGTSVNPTSFAHDDESPSTPPHTSASTRIRSTAPPTTFASRPSGPATSSSSPWPTPRRPASWASGGSSPTTPRGRRSTTGRRPSSTGTTERVIFSGDMSQTTMQYASTLVPPPSGSWTASAVNALTARVGYSSDVTPNPDWTR